MSVFRIAKPLIQDLFVMGVLLLTSPAWADAGYVMYVSGEASLTRGGIIPLTKGMSVEAGDVIKTGADGRVQLLMADGDRIALRPSTEFSIDEFSGPRRSKPGEPVANAKPSSWKSFYTLAKGGFRTLTQSLGQRDASSYQVRTPVATIGIRGTDYTVLYCPDGCEAYKKTAKQGVRVEGMNASVFRESAGSRLLFAALGNSWAQEFIKAVEQDSGGGTGGARKLLGGVSNGGIEVTDDKGNQYFVKNGEFFQTDNDGFKKLPEMPDDLNDGTDSEGEGNFDEQVEGEGEFSGRTSPNEGENDGTSTVGSSLDGSGFTPTQTISSSGGDLTGGGAPPPPPPPPSSVHSVAYVDPLGDNGVVYASAHNYDASDFSSDGSGNLTRFPSVGANAFCPQCTHGHYEKNTASNVDNGLDPLTNIHWGRWTGGQAQITDDTGTVVEVIDLTNKSLHWIYGPESASAPIIPINGYYNYTRSGFTNPTDGLGNVGTLDYANFSADFTNQQVNSSLGISGNVGIWNASGSGGFGPGGSFGGNYGSCNGPSAGCTGNFAGFFTPGSDGSSPPPGAGMTYSLDNNNSTVSGAAAFNNPTTPPPQ